MHQFPGIGLSKLASTEAEVNDMQTTTKHIKPELEKTTETTARIIQEISQNTVSVNTHQTKCYAVLFSII